VLALPALKAQWSQQGAVPLSMTPAEFEAYLRKDIEKWAGVITAAGIKVQQ
jgi:tripartite-type tricarboxylate transporter receptor subunit TctC